MLVLLSNHYPGTFVRRFWREFQAGIRHGCALVAIALGVAGLASWPSQAAAQPVPTISGAAPTPVTYGVTPSIPITVTGSNFVLGATITVGSLSGQTVSGVTATATVQFVLRNSGEVSFYWPNTSLSPGSYAITVTNPPSAGGQGATLANAFVVTVPVPTISGAVPTPVTYVVTPSIPIRVTGSNFVLGATITVGSLSGQTVSGVTATATVQFVLRNSGEVSFYWPNTSLSPGSYAITVTNPPSAGGQGATLANAFVVSPPQPVVGATAPNLVTYDTTPSGIVSITGSGFLVGATVTIGVPPGGPCPPGSNCLTGVTVGGTIPTAATPFVHVNSFQLRFYWPNTSLAPGPPPGRPYDVTVTNPAAAGSATDTLVGGFQVQGPVPTLTGITPSSVEYNDTPSASIRITGTNFYQPPAGNPSSDPSFVTVGPLTFPCVLGAAPATATTPCVHINRTTIEFFWLRTGDTSDPLHLPPGDYTVRVTNPVYAGSAVGERINGFSVTAPQPEIQAIRPRAVTAGITPSQVVDIVGVNNAANHIGFIAGAEVRVENSGLPPSDPGNLTCTAVGTAGPIPNAGTPCVFVGPGLLRFYWDTDRAANPTSPLLGPGAYDIIVTNPAARGGLSDRRDDAFRVTLLPELIEVAPTTVGSGARSAVITLTTAGFASGAVVRIGAAQPDPVNPSNPPYVQTQDSQVTTRMDFRALASGDGGTVVIDVAEDPAQPTTRQLAVTITSADGQHRFTCPDPVSAETCKAGLAITPSPVVASVTPALGVGASGRTLTIAGDRFVAPGATVTLPTGVSGACTAASATTITCTGVAVAASVSPGSFSVIVANPDGGRTTGTLTINAPPGISSLTPSSGTAGGAPFTVRVLGSGLQVGLGLAFSSDITVNTVQRIDATTVDVNVTIASGAADGYRSLTITNPDGGVVVAPQAFYVGALPADPALALATFGEANQSVVQYQQSLGAAWSTRINGPVLSSPPVWQVLKASPIRNERLLAVVDNQRRLTAHVWNGLTWANVLTTAAATGLVRPSQTVDVAFEQRSGRGVIVYAITDSTTLRYRLWDGASWSGEALVEDLVNGQPTTGRPLWVRLEARPNTNDVALVYGDHADAIAAAVWRGDRGGWEDAVLLTTAAASHEAPMFDVAFERGTGRAMVVWAVGTETTPHYRIWNRDVNDQGGWQAAGVAPSIRTTTGEPTATLRALRAVGDASSGAAVVNRIVLAAGSGTTVPALEALTWDGTQWSSPAQVLTTALRAHNGARGFDLVSQGNNGNVLAAYATTANPNGVSRTFAAASGAWAPTEVAVSLPASGSPALSFPAWTALASSYGIDDVALTQFDTLGRVLLARWNGAAWSAAIEAQSLGSGLVSVFDQTLGRTTLAPGKGTAVTLAQHLRRPNIGDTIPPGAPTLSAGPAGVNSVGLSWTAVASDGVAGGPVQSYEIQQMLGAAVTTRSVAASQPPGGVETLTITGLSGARTYFFDVRAIDAAGNRSLASNRVTVVTPAALPPPVTDLAVPADSIRRTSLTVAWTRPTTGSDHAQLSHYIVKYRTGGAFASEQEFDAAQPELRATATSLAVDGLQLGVTYWFAVKVVDALGASSVMSNAAQATTADHAPDAISDLQILGAPTTSTVTLRWTMPADDSGAIASYLTKYTSSASVGAIDSDAEFSLDNLGDDAVFTFTPQPVRDTTVEPFVETLVVTGLSPGTRYWFAVKAIDANAPGQVSPLSGSPDATTSTGVGDTVAPEPIADLAVVTTSTSSSSLTVSWTATGDDGTIGTATAYDLRYATFPLSDQNFQQGIQVATGVPANRGVRERATLIGLASNTQYFVALRVADEEDNAVISNLAAGQTGLRSGYTLVSVPRVLAPPNDSVPGVFRDDVGSTLTVYRWNSDGVNESDGCYDGYPTPYPFVTQSPCSLINTVGTGLGYYLYNATASTNGSAILDAGGSPVSAPSYDVALELGFNMVGNPYEGDIHLSTVMVKRTATGTPVTYQQAVVNGWVGPALLLFDGVMSQPYGVSRPEAVFKPWNGGWIQSFVADAIVVFPRP